MSSRIAAISTHLPELVVTNADLKVENPTWDMATIAARAGVHSRHIARADETALDLAKIACDKLFSGGDHSRESVDAIIFCTQSPDFIMPPNAHLLHAYLQLGDAVAAFDINLACSGYVYGLALAHSLIVAGIGKKVLLATADTYSKYIHPNDRSARVLFGDGAAVTLVERSDTAGGFSSFELASHGKGHDKFIIPAGGHRLPRSSETAREFADRAGNIRTKEHIQMDGLSVWSFINSAVPPQIRSHLQKCNVTIDDVQHFVFHQASRMTLDSLVKILDIPHAKVPMNLETIGNTVSASIPICLADALQRNRIGRGDRVLLSGFGVGLSYGTVSFSYENAIHVY
jgi:3-oxoacyl-[acyl-carrier-protein] synthase-3